MYTCHMEKTRLPHKKLYIRIWIFFLLAFQLPPWDLLLNPELDISGSPACSGYQSPGSAFHPLGFLGTVMPTQLYVDSGDLNCAPPICVASTLTGTLLNGYLNSDSPHLPDSDSACHSHTPPARFCCFWHWLLWWFIAMILLFIAMLINSFV